jgi:UDP-N-acetylglucosamine 2-epimerase (non-hydrolysing)
MDPSLSRNPRVMVCFGTRPEAIKVAPVIKRLSSDRELETITVATAQHREMLDQMLDAFGLTPDVDLDLMRDRQDLAGLTARAVRALSEQMSLHRPHAVLVQGDTTTAFCASLAAFYAQISVGHIEAGLRTNNPRNPFPEEINRRLITPLARWHFCPTERSAFNLRAEGVPSSDILVTGNTVIDQLLATAKLPLTDQRRHSIPPKGLRRRILVTLHRRETQGEAQRHLCAMLARIAGRPDVEILFPVHMSPAVRESVEAELSGVDHIHRVEPLDYVSFVHALREADLVVTDSGGIQEEAPSLGVPVLVMRDTTERPEGVAAGCARLCGTRPEEVERDIVELLEDRDVYERMARTVNPYGDGRASERILGRLRRDLLRDRLSSLEPTTDAIAGADY